MLLSRVNIEKKFQKYKLIQIVLFVVIFPENLRMTLISTDFQTEVGLNQMHCWKSVNIRGTPKTTGKLPM